jgi:hypothetical protein
MQLWILRRKGDSAYDGYDAFVVRAASEDQARRLADTFGSSGLKGIWVDPGSATCNQLSEDGPARVVLACGDGGAI